MKNSLTNGNSSKVIRSVILNEFSDSYGTKISLVRDFYSVTSYDYKVVRSSTHSDYIASYTFKTFSDAAAKFLYLIAPFLVF